MTNELLRRERAYESAYVYLAAIFIASLVVCNLVVSKFFQWDFFGIKTFTLSAGILPYPLTFLVTDILSECYGKRRANQVVISGLVASVFVVGVVLLADHLKSIGGVDVDTGAAIPGAEFDGYFHQVFGKTYRAVAASMVAYLVAQLVDIQLFHFWRRLTHGKHLWLRNNGSTILSQLVDTTLVVSLLFVGTDMQGQVPRMILDGWLFKMMVALFDTPFFYLGVWWWRRRFPQQVAAHDDLIVDAESLPA